MKDNAVVSIFLILLAMAVVACEGAAKVQAPGTSSKLPPPRPQLDDTPDLRHARFQITERVLELMNGDNVPTDVILKLEALKGNTYKNAAAFYNALVEAIGRNDLVSNREAILRHAIQVDLVAEAPFPGSQIKAIAIRPEGNLGTVFFDFDRSNIKSEFMEEIVDKAKNLSQHQGLRVKIEGHADERGTTEYNLALGQRRSNSVKEVLIANGMDPSQMETVSYGEERPAVLGSNEDAWAQNRRGVIIAE